MTESLARDLVERTRNVPYDVQRLAHELWDDAVRAPVDPVEPAMIEVTIARLFGAYRPILEVGRRSRLRSRGGRASELPDGTAPK